jgi:hypothetical protein
LFGTVTLTTKLSRLGEDQEEQYGDFILATVVSGNASKVNGIGGVLSDHSISIS